MPIEEAHSQGRIGAPLTRLNDERLLRGGGRYVGDLIARTDCLHVAMLRSPHPHAAIVSVDASAARTMPGVAVILTAADIPEVADVPIDWVPPGMAFRPEHPVLARDVVRYRGQVVAAVAAATPQLARDAAAAIAVVYAPRPAVVDQERALEPGAPLVHDAMGHNRYYSYRRSEGDVEAAFVAPEHLFKRRFTNSRVAPAPLEPRAVLSAYDAASGRLTHTSSSQLPHSHARSLAHCLRLPLDRLRFVVSDVGGGFGAKLGFYADDVICAVLSMRTGRPCGWIEGRAESFLATTHGRDHVQYVELATTRAGVIAGIRCRIVADIGAYGIGMGPGVPAINAGHSVTGQYRIPAIAMEVIGVATHRTPTGPYRGAGHPEATFLIERAIDELAIELGLDPIEIRRRNFVPPDAMPYKTIGGIPIDSGDFAANLDKGLALAGINDLQAWQTGQRAEGRLVGIGVTTFSEACDVGPGPGMRQIGFNRSGHESARLVVHDDGTATLFSGTMDSGQGHATALAQIVADTLEIDPQAVTLVQGDTQVVPTGTGTFNSRSMALGGSAALIAAQRIMEKARRLAAYKLQRTADDVAYAKGVFSAGPHSAITFAAVAREANFAHDLPEGMAPALDETAFFAPKSLAFAHGTHIAVVEVDTETGQVALLRYVGVDDCGRIINPLLAAGQVHGGAAQGIGQALMESMPFAPDRDVSVAGFDDYAMPHAGDLPAFETGHTVSLTTINPLGAKGIGEGATIAAPPALVNAVLDALRPLGVAEVPMPMTPMTVWRAIQAAREAA